MYAVYLSTYPNKAGRKSNKLIDAVKHIWNVKSSNQVKIAMIYKTANWSLLCKVMLTIAWIVLLTCYLTMCLGRCR